MHRPALLLHALPRSHRVILVGLVTLPRPGQNGSHMDPEVTSLKLFPGVASSVHGSDQHLVVAPLFGDTKLLKFIA